MKQMVVSALFGMLGAVGFLALCYLVSGHLVMK